MPSSLSSNPSFRARQSDGLQSYECHTRFGGVATSESSSQEGATPFTPGDVDYDQGANFPGYMDSIDPQLETTTLEHMYSGGHADAFSPPFNPTTTNIGNLNEPINYPTSKNQQSPTQNDWNENNMTVGAFDDQSIPDFGLGEFEIQNYQSASTEYIDPRQLQQQDPISPTTVVLDPTLCIPSNNEKNGTHIYDAIEAKVRSLGKTMADFREAKATATQKYREAMSYRDSPLTEEECCFVSELFLWQSMCEFTVRYSDIRVLTRVPASS